MIQVKTISGSIWLHVKTVCGIRLDKKWIKHITVHCAVCVDDVVRLVFWHRRLYKVFQRRKTMQGHDIQITTTEPNHSSSGFQFPLCFHSVWI